eukprot:COSAG01_NODE_2730_length_7172_cov_35.156087_1_plen_258_part_00
MERCTLPKTCMKRRINWGWAKVAYGPWSDGNPWESSAHTLPREVSWHPELQQLVFAPLEEQAALRGTTLAQLKPQPLHAGKPVALGLPVAVGNQSEVIVSFGRPRSAARLSVTVATDSQGHGTEFFVQYVPPTGGLQSGGGVVKVGSGKITDELRLSPTDKTIDLRIFVDNVFAEAYWMHGRVAMTVPLALQHPGLLCDACDMTVMADGDGVSLVSAQAWSVQPIWVDTDTVLRTPRVDGGSTKLMKDRLQEQQSLS